MSQEPFKPLSLLAQWCTYIDFHVFMQAHRTFGHIAVSIRLLQGTERLQGETIAAVIAFCTNQHLANVKELKAKWDTSKKGIPTDINCRLLYRTEYTTTPQEQNSCNLQLLFIC